MALEELGIDYCCSGNRSLADAAACEGVALQQVMDEIARTPSATSPHDVEWMDRPLRELIAFLHGEHRAASLEVMAQDAVLFDLVDEAHALDPELLQPLREAFHKFINELAPHVEREERILFPFILELEESWERGTPLPPRFEGGLRKAIAPTFLEHESLNAALRQFRNGRALLVCIDFRACRQLAHRLQELEHHLHEAMNLENFVLFTRAIELEDQLCSTAVPSRP